MILAPVNLFYSVTTVWNDPLFPPLFSYPYIKFCVKLSSVILPFLSLSHILTLYPIHVIVRSWSKWTIDQESRLRLRKTGLLITDLNSVDVDLAAIAQEPEIFCLHLILSPTSVHNLRDFLRRKFVLYVFAFDSWLSRSEKKILRRVSNHGLKMTKITKRVFIH